MRNLVLFLGLLLGLTSNSWAAGPIDYQLLTAQSMTGSFASPSIDLWYKEWGSIQASWTGASASGTLNLAVSNDNVNFSTYTGSSTTVLGPGNFLWNMLFCGFRYVELVYTVTSGTGSLAAIAVAKGT